MSAPQYFLSWTKFAFYAIILTLNCIDCKDKDETGGLRIVTVATEDKDAFKQYVRSIKKYDLELDVLGMGQEWKGGDVDRFPGGGQKILFLVDYLEKHKDNKDLLVMFTDSYDAVFTAGESEILKAFKKFDARVVFSAEGFCWPDPGLADQYPPVKINEKRYLNSGGFIGYANDLYDIVTSSKVESEDDDQLFYTKIFLDKERRRQLKFKLDTRAEIFQNLNGALDDVHLKFKGANSYLYNSKTGNTPIVVHGNGPIKTTFHSMANYLADAWTQTMGCQICKENIISLDGIEVEDMPIVMVALFVEHPTPFFAEFLAAVASMDYPKEKIDLFIHYGTEFHEIELNEFMSSHGKEYRSTKVYTPENKLNDWTARNQALEDCLKSDCQYYFALDSIVQIEEPSVLRHAIETNRSVIAPFVNRPNKLWSNFWGALNKDGYYKRSDDYTDIVQWKKLGIWNVPYIANAILVQGHVIPKILGSYVQGDLDPDMSLAYALRAKGIFMYLDNQKYYGHLVDPDNFETTHLHNDMYEITNNNRMWEKKYIHPQYRDQLTEEAVIDEPCPDVYWMPLMSQTFTKHLIEEMENKGDWSGGKNKDDRLAGGYENVPTVDIHANQIGWETHWLTIIKEYVSPLNQKVYPGYFSDNRAIMNFVVRYRPGEQDHLRPHHDASTYTINVALNRPKLDYQGGGVRFLRYNCTVTDLRQGWMLMHPGRLTHMHEGLRTTGGTRYIMVSFIDP